MSTLAAVAEVHLLVGIAVAVAFSLAVSMVSHFQRSRYLCFFGLIGAAAYYRQAFAGFVVVSAIAYATLCWINRQTDRTRRWRRAGVVLFLLIAVFTLGRVQNWEHVLVLSSPVPLTLYSLDMWLVLRLVTLFWEVGAGSLQGPSLTAYIIWICLPFTLGGPILRPSQLPNVICINRSLWKSLAWWMKITTGAAMLIVGLALGAAQQFMSHRFSQAPLWNAATTALLYGPVGFYLTNAGYFHLMESLGQPAGFKLKESFNFPFGRENISIFWANWNMTATAVFRDYLFYNRWGLRTYNVYFNTLLVFTLVGLWHAANAYWILWGFLHGLLFCGFLIWRKYGNRLSGIPLRGTSIAQMAARTFTYVSVCACWYLPSKIIQKLGGT